MTDDPNSSKAARGGPRLRDRFFRTDHLPAFKFADEFSLCVYVETNKVRYRLAPPLSLAEMINYPISSGILDVKNFYRDYLCLLRAFVKRADHTYEFLLDSPHVKELILELYCTWRDASAGFITYGHQLGRQLLDMVQSSSLTEEEKGPTRVLNLLPDGKIRDPRCCQYMVSPGSDADYLPSIFRDVLGKTVQRGFALLVVWKRAERHREEDIANTEWDISDYPSLYKRFESEISRSWDAYMDCRQEIADTLEDRGHIVAQTHRRYPFISDRELIA